MNREEVILAAAALLKDQVVAIEGKDRYIYTGRSMSPFLKERDIVVVKNPTADDLSIGDIIVYHRHGKYIIHRFLGLYRKNPTITYLIAKGDNSFFLDEPITMAQVVGKVISIKRGQQCINLENKLQGLLSLCIGIFSAIEGCLVTIPRVVYRRLVRK